MNRAARLAIALLLLASEACSKPDDLAIKAYGQQCGATDYARTSMKITDYQGQYHISISSDGGFENGGSDCHLVVDKSSGKIVRVQRGQ